MTTFYRVDKRRYSEQVIETIRAKILSTDLKIGDRLPGEKELIAQFNVSRTVVREAIRVLEESGLVEIKKGRGGGVFVTGILQKPISTSFRNLIEHGTINMKDLLDVRFLIEPHIASLVVANATTDDLDALQAIVDNAESHKGNVDLLRQDNIEFHALLARATGNPVLSIIGESIIRLLDEMTQKIKSQGGKDHINLHKQLLGLIREGKASEAKALITHDISMLKDRPRKAGCSSPVLRPRRTGNTGKK
jgi:GntR family transcriptional regulator, transcriptional repressor for pyruvate dehydrogenase complex